MKYFILGMVIIGTITSPLVAQEGEVQPNLHKTLAVGLGLESGTLVNNTDGFLDRNEFTAGISYSQNFANADWFSLGIGLGAINLTDYRNSNSGTAINPTHTLEGINGNNFFFDYAQLSLDFGGYLNIIVRQTLLTFIYGFYPISLSPNNTLVLYGGVEFFPYQRFSTGTPNKFNTTLDYLEFGMEYLYSLPQGFTYSTKLAFVSRGRAFTIGDQLIYEANSADAYLHNFEIEWDLVGLTYQNDNGFRFTGIFRYLASRLSSLDVPTVDRHVNHDFVLVMRLGYAVNFETYRQ